MTLTPAQNKVIYCLQNGGHLITSDQYKGALVASASMKDFHIDGGVFWRLVEKDLIYQGSWEEHHYCYVLTEQGETIKTKKP